MGLLLDHFGTPQRGLRFIHLAGSKGKGSTAALLAGGLGEGGFKTGIFTSPHVCHYRERIQVNGQVLPDQLYIDQINFIRKGLFSLPFLPRELSFFDLLTLLAILIFHQEGCEYCLLETGLGGRLDSTNIVQPLRVILTPIEREHARWLGETLEEIASEKGGIIKEGVPSHCAFQVPEVLEVLEKIARQRNSPFSSLKERVIRVESTIQGGENHYEIHYTGGELCQGHLSLLGRVQAENAALALEVLKGLHPPVVREVWLRGMAKVSLPGRMERLTLPSPLTLLDGAHTPQSVEAVLEVFLSLVPPGKGEPSLLFACQEDKEVEKMASLLAPSFGRIVITSPGFFKKSHCEDVYKHFSVYNRRSLLEKDPIKAFLSLYGQGPLLITGSFYLIGEIKRLWERVNETPGKPGPLEGEAPFTD